jgi:hypothetical protein
VKNTKIPINIMFFLSHEHFNRFTVQSNRKNTYISSLYLIMATGQCKNTSIPLETPVKFFGLREKTVITLFE